MSSLIATRQAFGDTLYELMRKDERIIALTADLGESLRLLKIRDEIPNRFIDTGVAEANMAGMAAGLALAGFIPVAGTFAVFLTRAFDHIRLQICQNNLPAIFVGSHAGVSNALDGGSANALEDIAYMRSLPNMVVVYPADANEMQNALPQLIACQKPVYLRAYREPTPVFTDPGQKFIIGKAHVIQTGNDITLIATGPQVAYALQAAKQLLADKISAEVINVSTIQPLDIDTIVKSAAKTGHVVTAEDHNINGGLGSAVAEALSENHPTKLHRIAVRQFGESGKYPDLIAKLGIDAKGIYRAVKEIL